MQIVSRPGIKCGTCYNEPKNQKVKVTLLQALRLCEGRTAHRGSRGIALPFHDHGTRRGWRLSFTPRQLFTPGKDPVPIAQEAEWAPGPVWTGAESVAPTGFDPRTVQPVANRYIDYATRPTKELRWKVKPIRNFILNVLSKIIINCRLQQCHVVILLRCNWIFHLIVHNWYKLFKHQLDATTKFY